MTRNGNKLYTQYFSPAAVTYQHHASDRVVLAANMASFQEASLGDINTTNPGKYMMVVAERPISIAVNATGNVVTGHTLAMVGASVSHLYLKNTNVTNTTTVEFVVTDQS